MVVKYSREELLSIGKSIKPEDLNSWQNRGTQLGGKSNQTPTIVSKKKGAIRATSAAPRSVWERIREERERKAAAAAAAKKPFQTTFSEDDRQRLASLREQLRGKSLPPPTTKTTLAKDTPPAATAAPQPTAAEPMKVTSGETSPARARSANEGKTPKKAEPTTPAKPAAAAPVVKKKVKPTAQAKAKASPEKEGKGANRHQRKPGGWGDVAALPAVDLEAEKNNPDSKKGLNASARAFFPSEYAAGVPFMRVEVPRPEKKKSIIQMLKLKPNDTVIEGRRVPPNKKFLMAMHPAYMAQHRWNQEMEKAARAHSAASSSASPDGRAASASSPDGRVPMHMWAYLGMPPPSEAEAEAAMQELERRQRLAELSEAVRRKRDEDRAKRFEDQKDEIHALLLRRCADADRAIDPAIDKELQARSNWEELTSKQRSTVRKEYRTQRLRSERLEIVREVTKQYDLSATTVATHLIEIITTKLAQKMLADEAKLDRKKKKWLKKMIAETSEQQVERRMYQRQRQLDIGSRTVGYAVWEKVKHRSDGKFKVPKPVITPIPEMLCSKRGWDGLIRQWRHRLHQYDRYAEEALDEEALKLHAEEIERNKEDGFTAGTLKEPDQHDEDIPDPNAEDPEDTAEVMAAAKKEGQAAFGHKEKAKIALWEECPSKDLPSGKKK